MKSNKPFTCTSVAPSIPAAISFHLPFYCTKGTVEISRTENPFVNLRVKDQIQFKEGPEGDGGWSYRTLRCAVGSLMYTDVLEEPSVFVVMGRSCIMQCSFSNCTLQRVDGKRVCDVRTAARVSAVKRAEQCGRRCIQNESLTVPLIWLASHGCAPPKISFLAL